MIFFDYSNADIHPERIMIGTILQLAFASSFIHESILKLKKHDHLNIIKIHENNCNVSSILIIILVGIQPKD